MILLIHYLSIIILDRLCYSNTENYSSFRVVLSKAKDVSRKPLSVFSIRFATRTPKSIRFSSRTERSEVRIEKTTIGVLDTLRYSNTENYSGFRVEPNEVRFVSRKPFSVFSIYFVTRTPKSIRFSSRTERSEVRIEKTILGVLDTLRYSNTEKHSVFE